jgi:hypothetical protein
LKDGSIVAEVKGQLQLWIPGAEKPAWTFQLKKLGTYNFQPHVAAMAIRSTGEILIVERQGRVISINRGGSTSSVKTPAYEYVQLAVEVQDVDWSQWDQYVESVSSTGGAFASEDGEHLYLVPNERSRIRKISVNDILSQPGKVVFLTDFFEFMFKDKNIVSWRKSDYHPIAIGGTWDADIHHPTAMAVCKGWVVVGTEEGIVHFVPEYGKSINALRREASRKDTESRSILDTGCIGPNLAYTVSEDFKNQILIWDLNTGAVVSSAADDRQGHPGMALAVIAPKSGTELLSLGDFDIRLWSIEKGELKLVSRYYPGTQTLMHSGATLLSGDFVVWDGTRFWQIPRKGGPAVYYAGEKANAMKKCDLNPTDGIQCWTLSGR